MQKIKKQDLMILLFEKTTDDISKLSYETQVPHKQADNFERLEDDIYDFLDDDEPCSCGSDKMYGDCDGTEKVFIDCGETILEDEGLLSEFVDYTDIDGLSTGIVSKKEIEDWINTSIRTFIRSYNSVTIGGTHGDEDPIFLDPDLAEQADFHYAPQDLNPKWTDEKFNIDDEKFEDFKEIFCSYIGFDDI